MSGVPLIRKHMKRRETPGGIRFVNASCEHRLPLLGNPAIRDLFVRCLCGAHKRFGFELFAWVVMPKHFHLLARPRDEEPLARALKSIKLAVAERVIARWREIDAPILRKILNPDSTPRFWLKGGGFDRNVRSKAEFVREVHYIHHNPVERKLVTSPEQWRWSSVHWWMG